MREDSIINNIKHMKQVPDFTGCQNGNMHPTDVDALLEFDNKYLILFEAKHARNTRGLPEGQRLVLERIIDAWQECRKDAIAYLIEHSSNDDDDTYEFLDTIVTHYYQNKKWGCPDVTQRITLRDELKRLSLIWDTPKLRGLTI